MLSHRIAALRKSKGLSQEQLAERVGVSRQAVSKWETGAASPEFDKLAALSACLGVSVDELVTGVPGEASPKQGRPTARRAGLALCLLGACLLLGAGMAALLGVLELLQDAPLDCGITVLFSNREEVNSAGAKTAGYRLHPDLVLAVDVSFANGPGIPKDKCGKLGGGPMIGVSPTLTPTVSQRLVELAEEKEIPYQTEVMGGSTGTNADSLSLVRGGRRSGLVSIPQRNMHTPAEIVDLRDMANTARLLAEYLKEVR